MPSKQNVSIKTENENSEVYEHNDLLLGKGKKIDAKITKSGDKQLTIKTPGFKDHHVIIKPEKRSPLFYPLMTLDFPFLFFGYGFTVSDKPKNFNYNKEIILKNEIKYAKRTETEKYISISALKLNIKDVTKDIQTFYLIDNENVENEILHAKENRKLEEEKLKKKSKKKKKKNEEIEINYLNDSNYSVKVNETNLTEGLFDMLKNSGYVDTVNRIFQDINNTLFVQGEINQIDEFIIEGRYSSYTKIGLEIKWQILNAYDEIIDSMSVYSFSDPFQNTKFKDILADAVDRSFNTLRNTDFFINQTTNTSDFSIKDEKLTIQKPKNIVKEPTDASLASVIIKRKDKGHGSGFAISNDGYILTNYHVIAGKTNSKTEEIKVLLSDGTELDVSVIRFNKARDIALLKVDYKFEKAFLLKSEKEFQNLMQVYTIGAPKSIELGQTMTIGLISNERKLKNNNTLQLNISINGGNSGGPLFDNKGNLHGVIQAKLVGNSTEGVGFAIPSYLISDYLNINYTK